MQKKPSSICGEQPSVQKVLILRTKVIICFIADVSKCQSLMLPTPPRFDHLSDKSFSISKLTTAINLVQTVTGSLHSIWFWPFNTLFVSDRYVISDSCKLTM